MKTNLASTLFVVLLGITSSANAQLARTKENRIVPVFETFTAGAVMSKAAYFDYQRRTYSLSAGTQFVLLDSTADVLGMVHYRYRQTCQGRPVEGSMLLVHTKDGLVKSVNGDVFSIVDPAVVPVVSEATALKKALARVPAEIYVWQQKGKRLSKQTAPPAGQLVWAPEQGNPTARFVLAYKFDVYALKPLRKSYVYISAKDGSLVWEKAGLTDVHVVGTAKTKYSGIRTLTTDSLAPGQYILEDETRGSGIATVDMQNTLTSYVDFTSTTNYWADTAGTHGAGHDVHWGLQRVYDYYDSVHHRNSYDNLGSPLVAFVHYDNNYANAFWNGSSMVFGDGSPSSGLRPLTSLDVVAHEATHGVTEYTAGLEYMDESGALNESFSDIFSKAVERRYKPLTFSWYIGKEIMANPGTIGMRSMSNPNLAAHPDTYMGTYWYAGSNDNGGVHTNSGVQNFWFYVLAIGKNGTNDFNQAFSVTGIGMEKAAAIAYRNLSTYLTPYAMYADARFGSIQAAKDLYGECSNEVVQVTNAWQAVGLGAAYPVANLVRAAASLPATVYAGDSVQLSSTSANAVNIAWYVNANYAGNANPQTYTFNSQGLQTVVLVATNPFCADTATQQVTVNPPLAIGALPAALGFRVYPNPANRVVFLDGTAHGSVSYQLLDLTGRVLLVKSFMASGAYQELISTAALAAGIYQLRILEGTKSHTVQVSVQH